MLKFKKVIKNSFISLFLQIVPIIIAIIFIPISIKALGNKLFGIYSLIITLIVLFNYLNFGIAPATTKELSRYLAEKNFSKVISTFFNSFILMLIIGILIGVILMCFKKEITLYLIKDINLRFVVEKLLMLLALLSPLLMFVIFLRSVLEAQHLFLITSLNRMFLNSIIFISPVVRFIKGSNIFTVFYIIMFSYIISSIVLSIVVFKKLIKPTLKKTNFYLDIKDSVNLLNIGLWMMIASLAGIVIYYSDRFFISALISITAVAYYVAAYDLVTRLNIISGSLTSALFPAFSHWFAIGEKFKIKNMVIFIWKVVLFLVTVISMFLIVFSKELLLFWINKEYSENSYLILQFLTIGVLFNTLSVIPFRTLAAIGLYKLVSIIYLIEIPVFLFVVYILINSFGIMGAVVSYDIRAFIEFTLLSLFMLYNKKGIDLKFNKLVFFKIFVIQIFFFMVSFIVSLVSYNEISKYYLFFSILTFYIFIFIYFILNQDDKYFIKNYVISNYKKDKF